jgi:tripartite-type tricarboxylate transporter receptor subunit TctC
MSIVRLAVAIFALAFCCAVAHAQSTWPSGTLRIIVPFGPGSTPDIAARIVAEKLAPRFGQPVIVENKPGASGNVGTDAVAKAAPDGRTIGISIAGPLAVNALLYKTMPYDAARDLTPITIAATQPSVLVASRRVQASNARELIALLKANPGKYNYSSMGPGTISHLAMEALAARAGTHLVHVPYNGSGPALLALLSGDVDLACLPAAAVMPQIKAGKLKPLAVATAHRSSALPEVPTLGEAGLENVHADAWMGFVAPARTPPVLVQRWHDELAAVLTQPDMRDKLRDQLMEVVAGTPGQFRAVMKADVERWKPVIEKNRITLD